jgi:hypothetical protein
MKKKTTTKMVKANATRPSISLRDSKERLRLMLRKKSYKEELSKLPDNVVNLVNLLLQSRDRVNSATYEIIAIWNKLRTHEKYWVELSFPSEASFLAHYCLPDGGTLAMWTAMVQLFDQSTFILLGEHPLVYLMGSVEEYQGDPEQRKKDYADLFHSYCRQHRTFSRQTFFAAVREFVVERYEKPLASAAGLGHDAWLKQKSKKLGRPPLQIAGSVSYDSTNAALVQPILSLSVTDLEALRSLFLYFKKLENLARSKIDEAELPQKPMEPDFLRKILP